MFYTKARDLFFSQTILYMSNHQCRWHLQAHPSLPVDLCLQIPTSRTVRAARPTSSVRRVARGLRTPILTSFAPCRPTASRGKPFGTGSWPSRRAARAWARLAARGASQPGRSGAPEQHCSEWETQTTVTTWDSKINAVGDPKSTPVWDCKLVCCPNGRSGRTDMKPWDMILSGTSTLL